MTTVAQIDVRMRSTREGVISLSFPADMVQVDTVVCGRGRRRPNAMQLRDAIRSLEGWLLRVPDDLRVWVRFQPTSMGLDALPWEQWLCEVRDVEVARACVQPLLPRRYHRPHVALIASASTVARARAVARRVARDRDELVCSGVEVTLALDDDVSTALGSNKLSGSEIVSVQDTRDGVPVAATDWIQRAAAKIRNADAIQLYAEDSDPFDGGMLAIGEARVTPGDLASLANATGAYSIGLTPCTAAAKRWVARAACSIAMQRGGPVFATGAGAQDDGVAARYHLAAVNAEADAGAGQRASRGLVASGGVTYGLPTASATSRLPVLVRLNEALTRGAVQRLGREHLSAQDEYTRDAHRLLRTAASIPALSRASELTTGWDTVIADLTKKAMALATLNSEEALAPAAGRNLTMAALRRNTSRADSAVLETLLGLESALSPEMRRS